MKSVLSGVALAAAVLMFGGCTAEPKPANMNTVNEAEVGGEKEVRPFKADASKPAAYCEDVRVLKSSVVKLIGEVEEVKQGMKHKGSDQPAAVAVTGIDCDCGDPARVDTLEKKVATLEKTVRGLESSLKEIKEMAPTERVLQEGQVESQYCKEVVLNVIKDPSARFVAKYNTVKRACPNKASRSMGTIDAGSVVKFRGCDMYGWCELDDQSGFVAGFLFKEEK